jgi:predicted CXXCH cytochrome family protein
MKRSIGVAGAGFVLLVVLVLALGSVALAAGGEQVIGSAHDLSGGNGSPCSSCHVSGDASRGFLWAVTPNTGGGAFSGLKAVCYSCHDGSVTSTGSYVFSTRSSVYSHEVTPLESGAAPLGDDCDRCHDPHDDSNTKFLSVTGGADVCSDCHDTGEHAHPMDVQTDFPLLRSWDPAATPPMVGTRLWDAAGTAVRTTGSAYIKCETCHAPHGAVTEELNTLTDKGGALCINCHG